ncbi:four helix bundle protein [Fontivita pretiosa]|uniref:four helix bundle protein n=1 Tax=Fontivita pretiosa TaxID=2989684 RepID=UPI003D1707CA
MKTTIRTHLDLDVYQRAFALANNIFRLSKHFPKEEMYSLTDQIRRSSRSICANLAEAWRKRRYPAAFVSKLSDAETETAETQVWIEFAVGCEYWDRSTARSLYAKYNGIIRTLVGMINHPETWIISKA